MVSKRLEMFYENCELQRSVVTSANTQMWSLQKSWNSQYCPVQLFEPFDLNLNLVQTSYSAQPVKLPNLQVRSDASLRKEFIIYQWDGLVIMKRRRRETWAKKWYKEQVVGKQRTEASSSTFGCCHSDSTVFISSASSPLTPTNFMSSLKMFIYLATNLPLGQIHPQHPNLLIPASLILPPNHLRCSPSDALIPDSNHPCCSPREAQPLPAPAPISSVPPSLNHSVFLVFYFSFHLCIKESWNHFHVFPCVHSFSSAHLHYVR